MSKSNVDLFHIKSPEHFGSMKENPEGFCEIAFVLKHFGITDLATAKLYAFDADGAAVEFQKVCKQHGLENSTWPAEGDVILAGFEELGEVTGNEDIWAAKKGNVLFMDDGMGQTVPVFYVYQFEGFK